MSEQTKDLSITNPRLALSNYNKETKKSITFKPGYYGNQAQFSVFGAPEGNLFFSLDLTAFSEFLEHIRDLANRSEREIRRWNVTGWSQEAKKNMVVGTLMCGRSEEGDVYVAVSGATWNKPIRFLFHSNYKFSMVDSDGNQVPQSQFSGIIARGWANAVEETMYAVHHDNYKPAQPKGKGGGNGSYNRGGYNRNNGGNSNNSGGGNGGGYNNGFDDSLDDFI